MSVQGARGVLSHQSWYSAGTSGTFVVSVTELRGLLGGVKPYSALSLYVEIYK